MKMIRLYLVLAILTFAAPSCNNDDVTAPPITQENTFSCKINGKLFVPEDLRNFKTDLYGIQVRLTEGNWTVVLSNEDSLLYFYLYDLRKTGVYELGLTEGRGAFTLNNNFQATINFGRRDSFETHFSSDISGRLEIVEFKSQSHLIMKFEEIILFSNNNLKQEKVVLTDGKLNINVETLNHE